MKTMLYTSTVIFLFISAIEGRLFAQNIPEYDTVAERLPFIWMERYPYPVEKVTFEANPDGRGILTASHNNRRVYYYHFRITIPRPVRAESGIDFLEENERTAELWVRLRTWIEDPFDLSFGRWDQLPGTGKRWIQR